MRISDWSSDVCSSDLALAERYFDHQAIEQKKALDDHNRATRAVGGSPLPQHQAAGIEREHDRAIAKYKSDFRGMYGWPSGQLGIPKDQKSNHFKAAAGDRKSVGWGKVGQVVLHQGVSGLIKKNKDRTTQLHYVTNNDIE